VSPPPLAALAAAASWLLSAGAVAAAMPAVVPSACTRAIAAVEARAGLPPGLLMAIGFTEAGRKVAGGFTVWPWTVNVGGEGHFFASRQEAIDFVRRQQAEGQRSLDVGCMQVNLRWHPDAFADLDDAFAPERNVAYAARFLGELRADAGEPGMGGWLRAAGLYHSATPEHAGPYRAQVDRYWQRLADPVVVAALKDGRDAASAPAAVGDADPFGLQLAAYWATPFGAEIGPRDEQRPVLDLAVRRPFADATPPPAGEPGTRPRPAAPVAAHIRRFSPPPRIVFPPAKPERRKGLLLQQPRS
jgi:hypothetical protein